MSLSRPVTMDELSLPIQFISQASSSLPYLSSRMHPGCSKISASSATTTISTTIRQFKPRQPTLLLDEHRVSRMEHRDVDKDTCIQFSSVSDHASDFRSFPSVLAAPVAILKGGNPQPQPQLEQQCQELSQQHKHENRYSAYISSSVIGAQGQSSSYQRLAPSFLASSSLSASSSASVAPLILPTSHLLLRALDVGHSQVAIASQHNDINFMAPISRYSHPHQSIDLSRLPHTGAALTGKIMTTSVAETETSMSCEIVEHRDSINKVNERTSRQEEEEVWVEEDEERRANQDSLQLQATILQKKRRASPRDFSTMTIEEQTKWKKARARHYSASARQRQMDREHELRGQVETLSMFEILIIAAPDAVLLVSPDARMRILFVNDQCKHLLSPDSGSSHQTLVGRCIWDWMDARDKPNVVATIGKCIICNETTRRVRCNLWRSSARSTLQTAGQMQQEPQHHHQRRQAIKVDLTLRLSERGIVIFLRPVEREE